MTSLVEEESRVKSLQEKLEKSIKTVESDLEREKSISLDADLNEKRISAILGLSVPFVPRGKISTIDLWRRIYKEKFFYQL